MRVAYIRRVIFSSRMGSAHRRAGTISPRFHLHVHVYANIHEESQTHTVVLSLSLFLTRSSLRFSDDRGQVLLRPCRADRMLPGFLRVQSGPRIRVVGCTGMHAVGWPGAFLRRCRVSYSPCPERARNERERERGARARRERRSEKGREKEPKEEGVETTSWALARPRARLERVFLPFRGGNRVCSGREDCLSRDPFPATARHRRSLLPISRSAVPAPGNR